MASEYRCWNCGEIVSWIGDFLESEETGNDIQEDSDRLVAYYRCPNCGSDYRYKQGPEEGWE